MKNTNEVNDSEIGEMINDTRIRGGIKIGEIGIKREKRIVRIPRTRIYA